MRHKKPQQRKTGGTKHDSGKVRVSLLSSIALFRTARVMTDGEIVYGSHNWRKGFTWSRPADAALRHLLMWIAGMDNDPDSGRSNLDHLAACVMMLQEFEECKAGIDDRHKIDLKTLIKLYPPKTRKNTNGTSRTK
jgi:hypothetical protein